MKFFTENIEWIVPTLTAILGFLGGWQLKAYFINQRQYSGHNSANIQVGNDYIQK